MFNSFALLTMVVGAFAGAFSSCKKSRCKISGCKNSRRGNSGCKSSDSRTLPLKHLVVFLVMGLSYGNVQARLEVCNQTDLVLMVAIGYDTAVERTASEGWWRVYPGACEVPVDVSLLSGAYYVHAESNPRSTMPGDAFSWGNEQALCVQKMDFRNADGKQCANDEIAIKFNTVEKNWRNANRADVFHPTRKYENQFRTKMAGVQRLLSILGYDVGTIDGVAGEKTVTALNEIGRKNEVFGFDFERLFPLLEQLIVKQQRLNI